MAKKIEAAKVATFTTDDKRAQYARLAVFNFGVKEKLISKDKDVNSVSATDMQKAYKALVGGTLLAGKEGIEFLITLTKKGATDPKVAERGLTAAYAQEVRPFIMRGTLSEGFGRRGGGPREKKEGTAKAPVKKAPAKKATGKKPGRKPVRATRVAKPAPQPEPEMEDEEPEVEAA